MKNDDPILTWTMGDRYRDVHRALGLLNSPVNDILISPDALIPEVVEDLERLAQGAREAAAASLGPTFHWSGPPGEDDPEWGSVVLQLDFDAYELDEPEGVSHIRHWADSGLDLASRAYRRECGWDFSPGEAGIWLLSVKPFRCTPLRAQTMWSGTLAAFVILHDRDDDAEYETLGHVWTAQEWRRRGIAAELVQLARERFPVRHVEGFSESGGFFLRACAPDLLSP
ncbi:GNAT family N-acetyltransferase [Oerskovia enterophila]|uniref:GNAT family N-acetyltransferase n=1 Tax=Oerskovia enterophila TaxID=43678 RepID=UPI0012FBA266|nr:GNAT family N-acetyltransferase [Oerskovia enterophila]